MRRLSNKTGHHSREGVEKVTTRRILVAVTGLICASAVATTLLIVTSAGGATVNTTPAASEMTVFSSARAASDVLPQTIASSAAALQAGAAGLPASEQPGSAVTNESRLLLSGQGNPQADLYAVPTSSGEVCYLLSLGPATCVAALGGTNAVGWTVADPDTLGSGSPLMVFGITPDNVSQVDIVVNGTAHAATLKNNGFFYQLADSQDLPSAITAIKVTYSDGSSDTISPNLVDPKPAP
ncbi:MAG: hypothetical protein ACRDLM_10120 [Gaiellaceae bacterium]